MEDGAAEGAETLPYFTVNSTAVPAYDAFCSALSGSRSCRLASSLRDGPRDCQRARVLLDHVHAPQRRVWASCSAWRRASWAP